MIPIEDPNFSLPNGWTCVKISDVIVKMSNGTSQKQSKVNHGIPVTRIETISNSVIDLNKVGYIENISPDAIAKYALRDGDILFSNINSDIHLGKTAIFDHNNLLIIHGMNLLLIRVNKEILLPKFLNYIFNYYRFSGKFISIAQHAVNQSSINQTKLNNMEIPLAPLFEQSRIVSKVEKLFTKLNSGIDALKKTKIQLKNYYQSILKYAFEGKLTEKWCQIHQGEIEPVPEFLERIKELKSKNVNRKYKEASHDKNLLRLPKRWTWVLLDTLVEKMQYGSSEKATDDPNGIPVLRMGNIQDGVIGFKNLKYYPSDWNELNEFLLYPGDILFNRTNSAELVGKTAVYEDHHPKSVFASYLIRITINKNIYNPKLLSFFINSFYGRQYISSVVSQQVGQANVNGTKLSYMPVPLLSLQEQHELVSVIEHHLSVIDKTKEVVEDTLKKANGLRQSILIRAFSGKLVSQDPNDEPASNLFKIKEEKLKHGIRLQGKIRSKTDNTQTRLI